MIVLTLVLGLVVGVAVGLVAVLAGLALWLAAGLRSGMKRLSLLIAMIALACVLGLIAVHLADPDRASRLGEDFLGRYAVWHLVMGGIAERPWTGWGMGVFELAFPALRDESFRPDTIWDKAHNDYLETVFGLGLPAAICLLISLAIPVISCVRTASVSRKTPAALAAAASAGAIAIIAGFDFPMQIQAISLLLLLLIGAGCAGAAEPKRKDRRSWSPKLN